MPDWRTLAYGSLPYHLSLLRPVPRAPLCRIAPPWRGDRERASALLASPTPPWEAGPDDEVRAYFHGFAWLADLAALATPEAREAAVSWTEDWLRRYDAYDPVVWRSDILGDRLFACLAYFDWLGAGPKLLASLGRQGRHLARVAEREGEGLSRLHAVRGLVAAEASLGGRRRLARAEAALAREIERQFHPDGGHRARSPAAQLAALRLLLEARGALPGAVPEALVGALGRAGLMLRFFRHGDGGLALFNGATEGDPGEIDRVLALAEVKGQTPLTAPATGFERLQAGGTVVLFDCGAAPPHGFERAAHAGALAFEMSHGAQRIIVNCGACEDAAGDWRTALRATAAHSTLVIADTNSNPGGVSYQRAERGGDLWVAATHDGYRAKFGLVHARQLFLASDGADLRGEDSLTGTGGSGFTIRFHLHPAIEPALQADANAVLLAAPGGAWRFRAEGAVIGIGESIYAGSGAPRKTRQIVLDGHAGTHGARVRWALRREAAGA